LQSPGTHRSSLFLFCSRVDGGAGRRSAGCRWTRRAWKRCLSPLEPSSKPQTTKPLHSPGVRESVQRTDAAVWPAAAQQRADHHVQVAHSTAAFGWNHESADPFAAAKTTLSRGLTATGSHAYFRLQVTRGLGFGARGYFCIGVAGGYLLAQC
jgi:hypothetical protein